MSLSQQHLHWIPCNPFITIKNRSRNRSPLQELKARSHGAICSACDNVLLHAILGSCSHSVMGMDAIWNVFILESHITITQNGYRTSCVTSHTPLHRMQRKSHHVNSIINVNTIHFLHRKCKEKKRTVWMSLYSELEIVLACIQGRIKTNTPEKN